MARTTGGADRAARRRSVWAGVRDGIEWRRAERVIEGAERWIIDIVGGMGDERRRRVERVKITPQRHVERRRIMRETRGYIGRRAIEDTASPAQFGLAVGSTSQPDDRRRRRWWMQRMA